MPHQPITPADRRRALLMDRERRQVENEFVRHADAVGFELRTAVARAYRNGKDVLPVIGQAFHDLQKPIAQAMLWGHLVGSHRTMLNVEREAPEKIELARTSPSVKSLFDRALEFLNKRDLLSEQTRDHLETQYNAASLRVLTKAQSWAEERVSEAMRGIVGQGLHVKAGMDTLRKAIDAAGLSGVRDNTLETLVRTQTQMAYSAGQSQIDSQPAIQEILWGYTYCTTHDDRVRPKHQAMDGTTLPKGDPWWSTHWCPCGYNCRCILLSRICDHPGDMRPPRGIHIVEPSAKMIDGTMVEPDPDPGFGACPSIP